MKKDLYTIPVVIQNGETGVLHCLPIDEQTFDEDWL